MPEESLFDEEIDEVNNPLEEWKGMPECNNTYILPFKQLIVNFKDKADYERFMTLIQQNITEKTKSIWFPAQETIHDSNTRYIDDEDESEVSDLHNF